MIIHFSPADSFSRRFLFHADLNQDPEGVHYFSIGKSGYQSDRSPLWSVLAAYARAFRLLAIGIGGGNARTVAYCHTTRYALVGLLLCRLFGVAEVVYLNHGVPYLGHRGLMRWLLRLIEKLNVAIAHRFVTVSPSMVPFLQPSPARAALRECTTWPGSSSGLRRADFVAPKHWKWRTERAAQRGVRYLYAGRLQGRKGLFVLLEAWSSHVARFPDDELWLCGFTLSALAAKGPYGHLKGLRVLGYVQDMRAVYDEVDVVVSPSYHEGFGYTLLEGAARGCCILCSAVPGPDVMFSACMRHLLFRPGDAPDLARTMAHLSGSSKALMLGRLLSYRSARRFETTKVCYPSLKRVGHARSVARG